MRKIKEIVKFEKENMPDYQYKFNYYFLFPFILVFLGGPIIALSISIPLGIANSEYHLLPIIIWAIILFTMLLILIPYGRSIQKRVVEDQVEKINKILTTVDYDLALKTLNDRGVCNQEGFFTVEKDVIPFEQLNYMFVAQYWGGKTFLSLVIHSDRYPNDTFLEIDNNVFTLIKSKKLKVENQEMIRFMETSTKAFTNKLVKRSSTMRFTKNDLI
jgi:hypothetical protein